MDGVFCAHFSYYFCCFFYLSAVAVLLLFCCISIIITLRLGFTQREPCGKSSKVNLTNLSYWVKWKTLILFYVCHLIIALLSVRFCSIPCIFFLFVVFFLWFCANTIPIQFSSVILFAVVKLINFFLLFLTNR